MRFNRQLIFTLVLIMAVGFLSWLVLKGFLQKVEIEKQLGDINSQIDNLKKEEERQKGLLEYLNTESYLEKQARLRLNLKKEGEEVVFIYRKEDEQNETNQEKQNKNPFLSKVREWFRIIWSRD
ncbi:MAG: hypothetical protein A3D40_01440 [Parcubacteria group bacterium RIFCSPHIGHO2_02_FULL_40_12]|nr:MAG: hypothetical protein A3D40_01440 [Parcubacteria group bacterium RIFCSPHIGHO2_02_FULL_40_12]